jgi:hypothetical protein
VNPWGRDWKWRYAVQLPHPQYPQQIHEVDVHEMHAEGRTILFGEAELSNLVYGFWVPED